MEKTFSQFPFLESEERIVMSGLFAQSIETEATKTVSPAESSSVAEVKEENRLMLLINSLMSLPDSRLFNQSELDVINRLILSNPTISILANESLAEVKKYNRNQIEEVIREQLRSLDTLSLSKERILLSRDKKFNLMEKIAVSNEIKIIEEEIDFI